MRLCSTSTCNVSFLSTDYFSSKSSFRSSRSHCLYLNLVSLWSCSLSSCDSSVNSDEKLFGDAQGFFLRIGTSSAVHLILRVSTAEGILSTLIPFTSQSMISGGLMDDIVDSGVVLALSLITSTDL